LIKHTGQENKGNDHERSDVLIFMQNIILPSSTIRNNMNNSEEKMHADIGA